jgi:ATP-dependent helicase/nuclease subunit B
MKKVITYNLGDNFIDKAANFIVDNYLAKGNDLSRIACVFGGRRPALFLRRALSERIKKSFIPPTIFSIDDFIDYLLWAISKPQKIAPLDASFLIYTLAKKHIPGLIKGRESFAEFLAWANEIVSFIEQLDLEDIKNDSLSDIEKSAAIGYEIPANINHLLSQIIILRNNYHKALLKNNVFSRGMSYRAAADCVKNNELKDYDVVLFCNFFYLHKTEQRIIKEICERKKGICIFQGSSDQWSVLKNNADILGALIRPDKKDSLRPNFSLYQGFDIHSQAGIIREILTKTKNKDNSVIVLPRPQTLIPLLNEISSGLTEFNVSMGYPLRASSLYCLVDLLAKAQESRKDGKYYTKDYLNLLRHPLVKNLWFASKVAVSRVMIHKIEELAQGIEEASIGGSLFLSLDEIEREEKIYLRTSQTLANINVIASIDECREALIKIHNLLFRAWEKIIDFNGFCEALDILLSVLVQKSGVEKFSFNLKVIEKIYQIKDELNNASFSKEKFETSQIWEIFQQKLQSEKISFVGSPLRGTQVLGLFETRSLNFENVIVMDANEGALPKLKVYEPLIPREVMLGLGLNRLEKEEEIQRYQFMRLISCAKNIHLVYEENKEKEKSRFIEELLWARQRREKKLEVASVPRAHFSLKVALQQLNIKKTPEMLESLRRATYSASRLNTYLRCPLQFYYQYVLGLKEKEDLLEAPQSSHIGTFIHELLEETFKQFIGKKPVIDSKFRRYFAKKMEERFEKFIARRMRSDSYLLKQIIVNRLDKFLDREALRSVEKIICLEEGRRGVAELNNEQINFRYTVDRIDELADKSIVIIDYKTGGADIAPKKADALLGMAMKRESIRDNIKSFQLPLYYYFVSKDLPGVQINAQTYNLRTCEQKAFIRQEDFSHREEIMQTCKEALAAIFREIFDPDIEFIPDKNDRRCQYCAFNLLCR